MKSIHSVNRIALFAVALSGVAVCAQTVVPLNTLDLSVVRQGWGNVQTNRSVDGNPLSIGGKKFERGVGTHAQSTFPITLDGKATRFTAQVGVDDEVGSEGSIVFQVLGDGRILWESGEMHGGEAPKAVDVKLDGVNKLTLMVQDAGDDINYDHGDWADARIAMAEGAAAPSTASSAAAAPSTASASSSTTSSNEAAILTPKPSPAPRINNAKVFGVRPGNPFLFTIAATGERPMTYSAEGLPSGLRLDSRTGRITGVVKEQGTYAVTFRAKNARGEAEQKFKIVCGPQIGLTPAMGWNSWNVFGRSVSDALARTAGDAMVKETSYGRLIDHGWTYINLDDGWERSPRQTDPLYEGPTRDPQTGKFVTNKKFPDMKALGDYIHSLGLKFGIYSGPGPTTCQGLEASYQHELLDAQTWAEWGVDYLKYDWCSYGQIANREALARLGTNAPAQSIVSTNTQSAGGTNAAGAGRRGRGGPRVQLAHEDHVKPYRVMGEALPKVPRDIIYSLCQYGNDNVWEWGAEVGGNSWRTTGDITDTWSSMAGIGFGQAGHEKFAGPGHWNDPDYLLLGWITWQF